MSHTLIEKFDAKLKQNDLLTPRDLVDSGLFGSNSAVRTLLRNGSIPSARISNNKTLINRDAVIEYLTNCISKK